MIIYKNIYIVSKLSVLRAAWKFYNGCLLPARYIDAFWWCKIIVHPTEKAKLNSHRQLKTLSLFHHMERVLLTLWLNLWDPQQMFCLRISRGGKPIKFIQVSLVFFPIFIFSFNTVYQKYWIDDTMNSSLTRGLGVFLTFTLLSHSLQECF